MGLAEPRKRRKISQDPRNLSWLNTTSSSESFGARMMLQQGWQSGQGLGSGTSYTSKNGDLNKVKVVYKDDMLGLGAKSRGAGAMEGEKTGLDAFQGLLGRLNAKDQRELEEVERKMERKKAERYVTGRWGGMVWVPGGLLVSERGFKEAKEEEEEEQEEEDGDVKREETADEVTGDDKDIEGHSQRRAEKRKRKEDRRLRREEKHARRAAKEAASQGDSAAKSKRAQEFRSPEEAVSSAEECVQPAVPRPESTKQPLVIQRQPPRVGRHMLRGRNIEAKRAAFADAKMLDEIFMRPQVET